MDASFQLKAYQLLSLYFINNGACWKDSETSIDFNGPFNGFHIIKLHLDRHINFRFCQNFIRSFAGRNVFFKCDKFETLQIFHRNHTLTTKGMLRAHCHDQFIVGKGDDFQIFLGYGKCNESKVCITVEHIIINKVCPAVFHSGINRRKLF